MSKQKKVIDIFRKEQNNILTDLAVASAQGRKKEDEKKSKELSKLFKDHDEFGYEIKKQKAYLNEIDDQIKQVKKKVSQYQLLDCLLYVLLVYYRYWILVHSKLLMININKELCKERGQFILWKTSWKLKLKNFVPFLGKIPHSGKKSIIF